MFNNQRTVTLALPNQHRRPLVDAMPLDLPLILRFRDHHRFTADRPRGIHLGDVQVGILDDLCLYQIPLTALLEGCRIKRETVHGKLDSALLDPRSRQRILIDDLTLHDKFPRSSQQRGVHLLPLHRVPFDDPALQFHFHCLRQKVLLPAVLAILQSLGCSRFSKLNPSS